MKLKFIAFLMVLFLIKPAQGHVDNPVAPAIAFLAGCGVNAALKKHPKLKKTANCVIGGVYLIAPLVHIVGFALEQTLYRPQYKNETYDFWSMFPELFLCYFGGGVIGDMLTDTPDQDKDKASV